MEVEVVEEVMGRVVEGSLKRVRVIRRGLVVVVVRGGVMVEEEEEEVVVMMTEEEMEEEEEYGACWDWGGGEIDRLRRGRRVIWLMS